MTTLCGSPSARVGVAPTRPTLMAAIAPLVCVVCAGASAASRDGASSSVYVNRPASGAVVGYVIDAETREPVVDALVSTQVEGSFPATGSNTARTDETGRYQLRAPLGRRTSGTKLSPLLIFGEPIRKKETNIIEVTQLNMRVTRDGYATYLGPVPIRHAAVSQYRVYVAEILLARRAAGFPSSAPGNFQWEYLRDFTVTPDVAERGGKVTMTARLRMRDEPDINHRAYAIAPEGLLEFAGHLPVTSRDKVSRIAIPLRALKAPKGADYREFAATARVRERPSVDYGLVHVLLIRGDDNITPRDAPSALLQAPKSEDENTAAGLCREAHRLRLDGEIGTAAARLESAIDAAPDYKLAHEMLGEAYLALNRPEDAVVEFRKVAKLDPDTADLVFPKLAEALLAAGKAKEGVALLLPLDRDSTTRKHRTESRMSPDFNVALARCYLALGNLEAADTRLKRAGLLSPELRRQLATERARALVTAEPDSLDAHSGLARALADSGRWEEAVAEFGTAASAEDADAWQYTDLSWALMEGLERYEEALPWARRAVADDPDNPEARLRLGDCYRRLGRYDEAASEYAAAAELRSSDFFARHWHGLMLLWQGDAQAGAEELMAALELAREKGEHRPKLFAFFVLYSTSRVLVHGFRYPEADLDYIILDAMTALAETRSDSDSAFVARYTMAAAFVELGLPDAALPLLRKCIEDRPECAPALYASARAHMERREYDAAQEQLEQLVALDVRHPQAYLDLATLRLKAGDPAAAQRYVLQHRRNYPESAPRTPSGTAEVTEGAEEDESSDSGQSAETTRGDVRAP